MSESRVIPERVKVLDLNNQQLGWADEHEARELIRTRRAQGLGNKRKIYALRMLKHEASHNNHVVSALKAAERPGRIPVIRPDELVAPSPRRYFGTRAAVHPDVRKSPQRPRIGDKRAAAEWDKRAVELAKKRLAERAMNYGWCGTEF